MGIKKAFESGKGAVKQAADDTKHAVGDLAAKGKPLAESGLRSARRVAGALKTRGQDYLATSHGRKVAVGAGAGAVLGVPLPILGPISGAIVGGAIGWWAGLKDAEVLSELEARCRKLTPTERQEELAALEAMFAAGQVSEEHYREGWRPLTGNNTP